MSKLILHSFEKEKMHVFVTVMTDHKTLFGQTALGSSLRCTWVSPSNESGDLFPGFSLFMDFNKCDQATNDKTSEATAKKLADFIFGKMRMEKHKSKIQFCSDHAIRNGILEKMARFGVSELHSSWTLCGSHDGITINKRSSNESRENATYDDGKREF